MALTTVKSDQIQTSVALAGSPTTTTQSASDNSTKIATTAYADTAVANLVASAPAALNTLDELAAALNDDASFSTTITNSIATKLPLAGGTLTGALTINANSPLILNGTDPLITLQNGGSNHWQLGFENTQSDRFVIYDNNASSYRLIIDSSGNTTLAGTLTGTTASFSTASTSASVLTLTDTGVAAYEVTFPDTGTYQLATNTTSTKTFKLVNAGSGQFQMETEGTIFSNSPNERAYEWQRTGIGKHWSLGSDANGTYFYNVTDGVLPIFIKNAGNVGIGVTDPTANLEIYAASTASHINMLKLTMPSWSNSVNYLKNIVWEDTGNDLGGIGLLYSGSQAIMHFHSFYNGGYKSESDILMTITGTGRLGIGETAPDRTFHAKSGANSNDGVIRIESANNNIMDMGTDGTGHFINCVNTDPFRVKMNGVEKLRIDNSASAGHLQAGIFGVTGLNTSAAIHGVGNDAALVISNGNLSTSNSSYAFAGRGGRYLTSNGSNWAVDGRDPGLVIGSSTATGLRGNGIGIILHNDNNTDNHYGPIVGWGTKSSSGSYNSMYAYIVGKRTGSGVDTNWSRGELQFDTAGTKPGGANAYMTDTPAMTITENAAIVKPYQPYIRLDGSTSGQTHSHGTSATYTNFTSYNARGITWNSSTGLVTLPRDGIYLITYSFYCWADNAGHGVTHEASLYKNSSRIQITIWESMSQSGTVRWDNTMSNSLVLSCSAGDTLKWTVYADIYGGPHHSNASVYMLG